MNFWKIDHMKRLIDVIKKEEDSGTITKPYINYLETELKLMQESFSAGQQDAIDALKLIDNDIDISKLMISTGDSK